MSLACLVCHSMDSPTQSFRSYSISSSEDESRCNAMVTCLVRKVTAPGATNNMSTAKVTPAPIIGSGQGVPGAPRLVRSRAVSRDLVRDWNFEEFLVQS